MVFFDYLTVERGNLPPYTPGAIFAGTESALQTVQQHGSGATR